MFYKRKVNDVKKGKNVLKPIDALPDYYGMLIRNFDSYKKRYSERKAEIEQSPDRRPGDEATISAIESYMKELEVLNVSYKELYGQDDNKVLQDKYLNSYNTLVAQVEEIEKLLLPNVDMPKLMGLVLPFIGLAQS